MTELAIAALVMVIYTYGGYPLLVGLWARAAPRALASTDDFEPTVSVCMAVHNGAEHLAAKLLSIRALNYPAEKLEILVCSDGSSDETERLATEAAAADPRIRLISNCTRRGKPAALNLLRKAA